MLAMGKTLVSGWVLTLALSAAPGRVEAQNFVLDKPRYKLTMNADWDTLSLPAAQGGGDGFALLGKDDGLSGVSYVSCEPGTSDPNLDSLGARYANLLGGNITKDAAGAKTLGKYSVKWQDFKYDSLPAVEAMVAEALGTPIRLRNGSFRVYYLVSDGYVFSMAGLRLLPIGAVPYPDIEAAITLLVLKPQSGAVRPVARRLAGGLWSQDGVLSGEWLLEHPAMAVDCFSLSGAFVGSARPDGAAAWILPSRKEALVVVVRARDGKSLSVLTQP